MALFQYKIKNDANEFSLTNIIYYRTNLKRGIQKHPRYEGVK